MPDTDAKIISFIIPCLNEAHQINNTLVALQTLRCRGHEIILSDGGSTDNTLQIAEKNVDHIIKTQAGRARQMNEGATHASGDILCFLHADTLANKNIDQIILNTIKQSTASQENIWGFFSIKLSSSHWPYRIIESLINLRSCLSKIASGDQGIFISQNLFKQLGGYADIPLMEDIELSKRLKKITSPCCIKSTVLITSSRRWEKHGIIATVLLMWKLRLLYFLGTPASRLANKYRNNDQT